MIISLKPILVTSLAVLATMSLNGAARYINYTGGTGSKTTNLYEAANWSNYLNGSPTTFAIDSDGNGEALSGDTIQLRVRGTNGATSAGTPATSNKATYEVDALNIGDFGEAYAAIATGNTLTTRNTSVGHITNNSSAAGNGTLYLDGELIVTNQLNIGHNAITNTTNSSATQGALVIRSGGTVTANKSAVVGARGNTNSPTASGTVTIETGGILDNSTSTQGGLTQGFVLGKQSGTTATLNMDGGSATIFSFILGDNNSANTGQTVNLNMNDGEINVEGWINGQFDDSSVTRTLTMDDGVIYLNDSISSGTGLYNPKAGEVKQLLSFFGTDADDTGQAYAGTLSASVIGGGLSDATLLEELQNNYNTRTGSVVVDGGTIFWGRDNDLFTDSTNLDADGNAQSYGRMAIWAVPEPSSAALIAGLLCIGLTLTRRRS